MDIPSKSRRSLQKLIFPSNQNLINPLTHWIASSNTEKSSNNQPYHAISISSRHLRGSCRSVCSDLGSNHPRPRFWKVFQSRLPVKHRNWVESYTNAGTARFYYDLVYFLLFSCLGFPEDLRKTNPAKVTRKLEIRWKENAKHSHTSVLKRKNVARHHGWCLRHLLWSRNVCSSLGNGSNGSNGSVSSWTTKKRLGVHNNFYSIITCYNITQLLIHGLEWLFNHASHASDTQASHAITSHAISEWQNGP